MARPVPAFRRSTSAMNCAELRSCSSMSSSDRLLVRADMGLGGLGLGAGLGGAWGGVCAGGGGWLGGGGALKEAAGWPGGCDRLSGTAYCELLNCWGS